MSPMVAQKLRVIQSNEMGFTSAVGDECWPGLKSVTAKEKNNGQTLRKTLFILKRKDGLRDLAVFDSEYVHFRDKDRKYVFEIVSTPHCSSPSVGNGSFDVPQGHQTCCCRIG